MTSLITTMGRQTDRTGAFLNAGFSIFNFNTFLLRQFGFLFLILIAVSSCSESNNKMEEIASEETVAQRLKSKKKKGASPMGIGTEENPIARIEFETLKLKNPATGKIPDGIRTKELAFAKTLPTRKESGRFSSWASRGPVNVGGRTRALALDVTDENIILAGGVTGGMWRSDNGGQHFYKTTDPDQLHSVTSVAQDRRSGKTNTWYYGTGEYYGIVNAAGFSSQFSGNGIFKSTDGGHSWTQLPSTMSNTPATLYTNFSFDFVWELVTDHTDLQKDVVLAAVVNGVFRSEDGGASWTPVIGLDSTNAAISAYTDIAISSTGVFYAAVSAGTTARGIWRSEDGVNWIKISPNWFPSNVRRIEIAIAPSDENQVWFIAETPGSGTRSHSLYHYKYISGDGTGAGGEWNNRSSNIPNGTCTGFYTFDFGYFSSQSSYDLCIAVHPTNPDIVFLGGTNIYRNVDGFTTTAYDWIGGYQCDTAKPSNYVYPEHHPDQHKMIFLPSDPNVMISAHDGGISVTRNCLAPRVEWENYNNGYNTGQFYTIAIEPGNTHENFMVGGLQDNGTWFTNSYDPAQPWKWVFYGDGAYCAITRNRNFYYLSWQTGKTFKFIINDDGEVQNLTRIDPIGGSGYQFINPFILDPEDDNVMYLSAGKFIWRNDDLNAIPIIGDEYNSISQGWTKLNNSSTGFGLLSGNVSCLTISPANNNWLFYGTDDGKLYRLDSARTADLEKVNLTGSNFPGGYLASISVDTEDADHILVSFSNYGIPSIFHSTDGGASWTDVSGNLEENPDGSGHGPSVPWVHLFNTGDSIIYFAGTSIGLFSTTELNGQNTIWKMEGEGVIGNVVINMIVSRPYDGLIVAATHGNGVYSKRLKDVSGISKPENRQNATLRLYPNPAHEMLHLNIENEIGSQILVEIFSQSGSKLWSNKMSISSSGSKNVSLNLNQIPGISPGVHFVRVIGSDGMSSTGKFVFQR